MVVGGRPGKPPGFGGNLGVTDPLGCVGGNFVGLGLLKDICLRG